MTTEQITQPQQESPIDPRVAKIQREWKSSRWKGITRDYSAEDVIRLRGSRQVEYTHAKLGAERFWKLLNKEAYVPALGALTGNQAVEQVKAGLKAIYVSGWQVAADANLAGQTYPDQSLYPSNSVPKLVEGITNALQRADEVEHSEGKGKSVDEWFVPIVADAEAGFGGKLNVYEVVKSMIRAGAAAVHLEDQLASEKKCGHLGGKVLIPTSKAIENLKAARLAADVMGVPTILIARTDADSATLLDKDIDERDQQFIKGRRTPDGFFQVNGGVDAAISRGLSYAPYADVLWMETSTPNLAQAKRFADAIHKKFPKKLLAYNCSPSFNWGENLDESTIAKFQKELGKMGYKFQFVTLAGFHSLNHGMFELARDYKERGMAAYSDFQKGEFGSARRGYNADRHQRFVGTGYFDKVSETISNDTSTKAMGGSTEAAQFNNPPKE
ncbi:MAG TPA: isocitrate lyase [Patescibacteria group bacterium]